MSDTRGNADVYRFKFSEQFQNDLCVFVEIHRHDDPTPFRTAWNQWMLDHAESVEREAKLLADKGYDGDVSVKIYKSARYYHKQKSNEAREKTKRQKYVPVLRAVLDGMDRHVQVAIARSLKPSAAYGMYLEDADHAEIIRDEKRRLVLLGMDADAADRKIKKTYKNRYFIQQQS